MTTAQRQHPLIDLLVSIVLPSVILMKFSGDGALGPVGGLLFALALPAGWGIFEFVKFKKRNWIAVLGVVSVLLTGGIGLLKIDTRWLAIKEAAIPGLIGIAIFVSSFTKKPLARALVMNPHVFDVETIAARIAQSGKQNVFEHRMVRATQLLSMTFFFSSLMNFILARVIVISQPGTLAFNEQLGRLTLMSYPMIVLPSMIMTAGVVYYLWRSIRSLTGLTFEQALSKDIRS